MKKLVAILLAVILSSMFLVAVQVRPSNATQSVPDPVAIDLTKTPSTNTPVQNLDGLPIEPRGHHSAWNVGDQAYWFLYVNGAYGYTLFTLRAIGNTSEIWVQNNLKWPTGDVRSTPVILDTEIAYLMNQFENNILPTDTNYFGNPVARDGSTAAFPGMVGLPADYYAEGNTKNVILVENVRDTFYYSNGTYPYYIAGFFDSSFDYYFDRNVITINSYQWERRLGPLGTVWIPPTTVTRPFVYEATIAHEYQHLIENDWNPADPSFMNEGCSMFAEFLCGYGIDPSYVNSYLYTPDNSLTDWSDQGDINILADYGAGLLWAMYLNDHYGSTFLSYFVQNGIPGIDGVNAALTHFGYKHSTFGTVFHDWRIANLIHTDFPGCKLYNYKSLNLNDPTYIFAFTHSISGLPVPQTKGTDFGNTITILGYDTGVSMIGSYGSDYMNFTNWKMPGFIYFQGDKYATFGWTQSGGVWWSGYGNLMDTTLISQAITVTSSNPTLTLVTAYGIETNWDFGFVQVSTDNGATWISLSNSYTTSDYLTDVPAIQNNMPGLTGYNPDWPSYTTMTFNLSAYIGKTVLINFRYMTDEYTNYEGWFIQSASVGTTALTLTPTYPKATYQVTVIQAFVICGKTVFLPYDMCLTKDNKGMGIGAAIKPSYVLLIVSPTMHMGFADYQFQATKLPIFKFC